MHPHPRPRGGAGLLGKPDVIGVRVREQHRVEVAQVPAELPDCPAEQVPVPRRARVHQHELARVLDQVEVRDAVGQAMDSVSYFGHVIVLSVVPARARYPWLRACWCGPGSGRPWMKARMSAFSMSWSLAYRP